MATMNSIDSSKGRLRGTYIAIMIPLGVAINYVGGQIASSLGLPIYLDSIGTVIVAAISSKVDAKAKLPTHYLLKAENGLELPSLVLLEQLRTIDKKRLETYIGRLEEKHIRRINHALAVSVGLIEEVPENLIMCLCPACANNFYGTGSYYLKRVNPAQQERDICTYCGQRPGFDYEVVKRHQ